MTTTEAIKTVKEKFPHVRPAPIENVAIWEGSKMENYQNLKLDTRLYQWKGDLLEAVTLVLKLQNKI